MNRSFDATTSSNTLFNSCDRWENSYGSDKDVAYLKVPQRRPSTSFLGGNAPIMPIKPKPCSASGEDECCREPSVGSAANPTTTTRAEDWTASCAWLHIPQFPVPENKHLRCRVSFAGTVEQREYAVTLGDNPSCHGPCALTLDWCHTEGTAAPYNDQHGSNDDAGYGIGHAVASGRPARYLSASERRERVLAFMPVSPAELQRLENELVSLDGSNLPSKPLKSTRRRAVWQKGHVRRPSFDDP